MSRHNQDPTARKYASRERWAARTIGFLGLASGLATETARVEPATATPEVSETAEAQLPHTFIMNTNNRVDDLAKRLKSAPGVNIQNFKEPASGQYGGNTVYVLAERGTIPGRFNVLVGSLFPDRQKALPLNLTAYTNANSKIVKKIKSWQHGAEYVPLNPNDIADTIDMWESNGPSSPTRRYRVTGRGSAMGSAINYSNNPTLVATHFNKFIDTADKILDSAENR